MISALVIIGLIVVWSIVLLPDLLSRISTTRRGDTIRSFNSQLSSLGRSAPVGRDSNVIDLRGRMAHQAGNGNRSATGRSPSGHDLGSLSAVAPRSGNAPTGARPRAVSPAVRKRRQDVLLALGAAALLTLLATLSFGGVFLYLHLLADLLLAGYLVLLQRAVASRPAPQRMTGATRVGALAPLGGPAARVSALEPRRIAN